VHVLILKRNSANSFWGVSRIKTRVRLNVITGVSILFCCNLLQWISQPQTCSTTVTQKSAAPYGICWRPSRLETERPALMEELLVRRAHERWI